jgi:hypothetical protein
MKEKLCVGLHPARCNKVTMIIAEYFNNRL